MQPIDIQKLEANGFYWARRKTPTDNLLQQYADLEVIQISTVFGSAAEFWTVAVVGSDEHFALEMFDFFRRIQPLSPPTELHVSRPNAAATAKAINH